MRGPKDEPVAVRHAILIAIRIAQDEEASDDARRRYMTEGLPVVEETGFARLVLPGELLHASRQNALLERTLVNGPEPLPEAGTLYLSSERLLHIASDMTSIPLGEIEEMAVALERLLLVRLRGGTHLAIEIDRPRLFRVQIAAAMVASRMRESAEEEIATSAQPASQPAS